MDKIIIPNNKYADDNEVYSYKNRSINFDEPIFVYKNTIKKCYSIKQNNQVVAHAKRLCIRNVECIVNEKIRERVVKNQKKEVHAYLKGYYATNGMGTTSARNDLPVIIKYNPYLNTCFITENLTINTLKVNGARFMICDENGVTGAYTNTESLKEN